MRIVPIGKLRNHFIGVLLAGGRGERFRASAGRDDADKLLAVLPDGRRVAVASAQAMLQALPAVIAVVRPGSPALRQALHEAGCIVLETADAGRGMGASLARAARELAGAGASHAAQATGAELPRGCLVGLADMPWIGQGTLQAVQRAGLEHRIAAPTYGGRRGHPVAFAWDLLPELAALDGDEGARGLLKRYGAHEVPCDDPGVLRDVDTLGDLR
jgi:molybdenum cofactor cytidylyltransferase